jgi:thiol peroxidase
MTDRSGVVTFGGNPVTLTGNPVKVGEVAPDFVALRRDFAAFSLGEAKGKVLVISSMLSFDTSVCATETRRFNQEAAALGEGVKILAISMDLPFTLGRFCAAEGIANLETLSDHRTASFGLAYGLLVKELRVLARAVIVVDGKGVIRYQQIVPEIGTEPDYDAALKAVKALA